METAISQSNFAVHRIEDYSNEYFSWEMYSRFKHGSKKAARKMGRELAEHFINSWKIEAILERGKTIVIAPSPYNFIPTATFALKDYFIPVLNTYLVERSFEPVQETKMTRSHSYNTDYSTMSKEDRRTAISAEKFYIDKDFVEDKFVIFLDDVRITGSHEISVNEMIQRQGLVENGTEYMFMYYATVEGQHISPSIEDEMNRAAVQCLLDINSIIREDKFLFNTRNIKFILTRNREEFETFIAYQSKTFQETLYHFAVGNSYYKDPKFQSNFNHLKCILDE